MKLKQKFYAIILEDMSFGDRVVLNVCIIVSFVLAYLMYTGAV